MLVGTVKQRTYDRKEQLVLLVFIITAGFFAYFSLTNPARQFPSGMGGRAAFYLPDWLLVLTIVVPYIYMLFCGFRTAYNIHIYCTKVAGVLYRRSLNMLAYGIALTSTGVMAIRFMSSISSWLDNTAKLRMVLAVAYALLIVVGIGYFLIAAGTKKLQKIEEA